MYLNTTINDSTAITALQFTALGRHDFGTLRITFTSGAVYDYFNVTLSEVYDLLNEPSVGKAFRNIIRNRYEFAQVG